jgi:hypothetical protein
MIRIACTNCKTVLSIDDAFAGGVCRCQHCGTIQTVPATATAGVGGQPASSKSLYQSGGRSDASGTGLDDLANVVASSGLSGSGLTSRRLRSGVNVTEDGRKNLMPIFIAIGAVFVVMVIVIVWLATRGGGAATANNSSNFNGTSGGEQAGSVTNNIANPTPASPTGSDFCGVKLTGTTVIYLLDRGSATADVFSGLKDAALKSALSLGTDRTFQIVFWDNGSTTAAYPQSSATYCTKENIDAARRAIDDVSAFGTTDVIPALKSALAHNPDTIVLATSKGWDLDLDNTWLDSVMAARGSSPVKIDTISLGSNNTSTALKALAAKTGGEYKEVSDSALKDYIEQ